MALFKKTKMLRDFSKLNKLIYGWPKSGKTTLAAQQVDASGKEPLFITTEDGHHALEVYAQRVTSWDGFLRLLDILKKNRDVIQADYSCFVIDLVSDLDAMCAMYVAKKNNVQHLADLDFGKGWALQRFEFQTAIGELLAILPTTFIAHAAEKDLQWNNEKIKVQAPSMAKACLEYVNGKVDAIMWMLPANTKKEMPEVSMRNSLTSIAGSRYKQLNKSFTFYPDEPSRTYKEIQKAFAGPEAPELESTNVPSEATIGLQ